MNVEFNEYSLKILADEDKPLFEEAERAASSGALRAAYIMVWLSCAESFKRRFKEAQKWDHSAGKIVGQIKKKESDQKSVDKYVLEQARDYGFINDTAYNQLLHIYDMRCIYGHPYEDAPEKEELVSAASTVVNTVLSQPIKLREGFISQIISNLMDDVNYLDDYKKSVRQFAIDILPKIDEELNIWFLKKYWMELEKIVDDPSMGVFFRRGYWFSQQFLISLPSISLKDEQWHDIVQKYPKTSAITFSLSSLFQQLAERAQDYIIGAILERSKINPSTIQNLENLLESAVLTERQQNRFSEELNNIVIGSNEWITQAGAIWLKSSCLKIKTIYPHVIDALKTHNWYTQNPAIELIYERGINDILELTNSKQEELGRNILQTADGCSTAAIDFFREMLNSKYDWPQNFLKGIIFECFVNERNELRFKEKYMEKAFKVLETCDVKTQNYIVDKLIKAIESSECPPYRDFSGSLAITNKFSWAKEITTVLEKKITISG